MQTLISPAPAIIQLSPSLTVDGAGVSTLARYTYTDPATHNPISGFLLSGKVSRSQFSFWAGQRVLWAESPGSALIIGLFLAGALVPYHHYEADHRHPVWLLMQAAEWNWAGTLSESELAECHWARAAFHHLDPLEFITA